MPKVSVCVPIYGVEKYIERCVKSLFEQTLVDMEFIFVDDSTKDKSIEILKNLIEDYPNRKHQVKILRHEQNMGLSFARETGVKAATGDYIAHCDSDDWVKKDMFEKLYNFAEKGKYDFVKSGKIISDGDKELLEELVFTENGKTDRESVIRYLLLQKGWNSIWNVLVARRVYEKAHIIYTPNAMLEDYFLVTQLLLACTKIGIVNAAFYFYFINPDSISRVVGTESLILKSQQAEKNIKHILFFIDKEYGTKFKDEEIALLFIPRRILIPVMNRKENFRYWKITTPGISLKILQSRYISFTHKLWYLEAALGLRLLLK